MDGQQVTREDVERRWSLAIHGGKRRREASAWAEYKLEQGSDCEELVLQGLLYLQALVHRPRRRSDDVAANLESWRRELEVYDRDPQAWTSKFFVAMLHDFAKRHGIDRAHDFAGKLHREGHIADGDLQLFTPRPR